LHFLCFSIFPPPSPPKKTRSFLSLSFFNLSCLLLFLLLSIFPVASSPLALTHLFFFLQSLSFSFPVSPLPFLPFQSSTFPSLSISTLPSVSFSLSSLSVFFFFSFSSFPHLLPFPSPLPSLTYFPFSSPLPAPTTPTPLSKLFPEILGNSFLLGFCFLQHDLFPATGHCT